MSMMGKMSMVMEKVIPLTMIPQAMEVAEFNELRPLFAPMLHTVSIVRLSIIVFFFFYNFCCCCYAYIGHVEYQVCLVYSTSEFYNSPARIIILMTVRIIILIIITLMTVRTCQYLLSPNIISQEVCNLLIDQARKFLDPETIFQIEVGANIVFQ